MFAHDQYENGDAEEKEYIVEQLFMALKEALAPKYTITRIGGYSDVDPTHIMSAMSIECVDGEGDEDEISAVVDRLTNENQFLMAPSEHKYLVDSSESPSDDLLSPFGAVTVTPASPEVDAFMETLFEQYVLGLQTIGKGFHQVVWRLKQAGVDKETAAEIARHASNMYCEGADQQAYLVSQLIAWDQAHPDGPTSLAVSHRAFMQLGDHNRSEQELELLGEQLEAHLLAKHHWRYHQINVFNPNRDLFDGMWDHDEAPEDE